MRKPLCIDLFCGLGGWTEGFLAEGYDVVGFDIERHQYGNARYPAQLVLQDVLTLQGSQFRNAAVIVASPPCQKYSYMAMPWSRAKEIAAGYRADPSSQDELNALFNACFRIAKEANVPLVVENVKGAQPWVGSARWHYGSFYLWGDVPALMPLTLHRKVNGFNFHQFEKTGQSGGSFQSAAVDHMKTVGHANKRDGHSHTRHLTNQRESDAVKNPGINWSKSNEPGYKAVGFNVSNAQRFREGTKQHGSGAPWFDKALDERRKEATAVKNGGDWFSSGEGMSEQRRYSSRSDSRKAASAMIAKIPFELSSHIARCFKPR